MKPPWNLPPFRCCSILLTFEKLMFAGSNRTTTRWIAPARRGRRVGAIWGSAEGAALRSFGKRADHIQLGRAVLFCSLSRLAKPVLEVVASKDGEPPQRSHRRAGTTDREGLVPDPRDQTYRGYSVRENPWLQLRGRLCVPLHVRYAPMATKLRSAAK